MYNSYFSNEVRERGYKYFKSGKVTDLTADKNKLSALVTGTEPYYVEVLFNESDDRIIENAKCDCPYFKDREGYCKHIYATILSAKYDQAREEQEKIEEGKALEKSREECEKHIKICKKILKTFRMKLIFNRKYLTHKTYKEYFACYKKKLKWFKENTELARKDSKYISFYKARQETFKRLYRSLIDEMNDLNKEIQKGKEEIVQRKNGNEENHSILYGLLSLLTTFESDDEKSKTEELKVGDWVEILPEGEYGEILNIYEDKYEVLFDTDPNDKEDIDIFRREELKKIRIE